MKALLYALLVWAALAVPAWSWSVKEITVNTPEESKYLFEDASVCREIGSDPFTPFTRVGDHQMHYTYKFDLKKGACAFLLLKVATQFNVEASVDNSAWQKVCDYEECDTLAGRTLVDLTPFAAESSTVFVRFTDKYPKDGWGALLSGFRLYTTAAMAPVSRVDVEGWTAGGRALGPGECIDAAGPVEFTARVTLPAGWSREKTALYVPDTMGTLLSASVNGKEARIGTTWDRGKYITGAFDFGGENLISLTLSPDKGRAGIGAPARAGLLYTACAAPARKLLDGLSADPLRTQAPYTYDKMNYIAGNYTGYIFDERYDLLGFNDDLEIHYLHDTSRNICALAEEERFTPVVRPELIERLYKGLKGGIVPMDGDDLILSFKHDRRPVDIRPLEDTPLLTMVQKMDLSRKLCTVGVTAGAALEKHEDTPLRYKDGKWEFGRRWTGGGRSVSARNRYYLGDSDLPPSMTFTFDGRGSSVIDIGSLGEADYWFRPGSWGPETVTFPNGLQRAAAPGLYIYKPDFDYLIISGGNGMGVTDVPDQGAGLSLVIMWDRAPERIWGAADKSGRKGALTDLHLEYPEDCKKAEIRILPFMDYPNDQKAVIALADRVSRTGRFGMGFYNPYASTFGSGIGADGFAAAAYIFDKYHMPLAEEAKELAARALSTAVKYDQMESGSNQLYHLIKACLYMHLLGDTRYDLWGVRWADRIVKAQREDGSWTWDNWQCRNMSGLISAWEMTGDDRYMDSVKKGLATVSFNAQGERLWKGSPSSDDFTGAGSVNLFGYVGDTDSAQKAIDAAINGISDGGFFRCSDLNPYMLGLSAAGMGLFDPGEKLILGLTDSAVYDREMAYITDKPTCYIRNRHHPLTKDIDFPLDF